MAKKNNRWQILRFDQEKKLSELLRDILHADLLEPIFEKCKYLSIPSAKADFNLDFKRTAGSFLAYPTP